jgi:hypothetical protein
MWAFKILAALTLVGAPLAAQTVPASNAEDMFVQRLTALLDLPRITADLRDAGIPDSTVQNLLYSMEQAKLPETDQVAMLTVERDAAREHGPTNNFGAFVQSRLAAGDRGQVLAKAIRDEHARGRDGSKIRQEINKSRRNGQAPKSNAGNN